MAYQIPQQLEYKEIIMFGLTFKQLVYALIFGLICILIFKKINNSILRYTLMALYSGLGLCFIFFDLESRIKNYRFYLKNRNLKLDNTKLCQFLQIKEIKDDVIISIKDKKIAVIKVNPINFSIKLSEEKESIMYSFQKFLNSLDFPTQILMSTESLDLESYLDSLESRTDQKFKEIFDDYKKYLIETIQSKKIMNRVFYVIFPEQTDIEIQVTVCIERFNALNLRVHRLKDKELEDLVRKFFPIFRMKNANSKQ
jgi:hypothetical protein